PLTMCLTVSPFRAGHGMDSKSDQQMPVSVNVQTVHPRKLPAVRREVARGAVGSAWAPALGKVWPFIRRQPGLSTTGPNIFLSHHPAQPGAPKLGDFGSRVARDTPGTVPGWRGGPVCCIQAVWLQPQETSSSGSGSGLVRMNSWRSSIVPSRQRVAAL